jgi:uncharacterized repeat protein (TIGR02543 family)
MKKGIYSLLAVLTVFAMVLTGCPGPEPTPTPTYTVTFDSQGGNDVAAITGVKSGAKITAPTSPTNNTEAGLMFLGWYKEAACTNKWVFGTDTVTGDITLYAKWGKDATISVIKIDSVDIEDESIGGELGAEDEVLANVTAGIYEVLTEQPNDGVKIEITARITAATIEWAIKRTDPVAADWKASTDLSAKQKFQAGDKLYIKVTNGPTTLYYKINFYFAVVESVKYGRPTLAGSNTTAVDPLWEANYTGPIFYISRLNRGEVQNVPYRFSHTVKPGENHTDGTAKAYWDDYGLYIYATITYNDYFEDENATTPTPRVTNMRGNFESDSLEIMINTRRQEMDLSDSANPLNTDRAQQYRVGFSAPVVESGLVNDTWTNDYGTFTIGGNFREPPTNTPAFPGNYTRYAFAQTSLYNAWITKDANNKETGYKVICRVPWFLIGYTTTDDVFDTLTGLVKDDAKIGLDFQINASITGTSRDALLTCSSVSKQAVTDNTNYAVITLEKPVSVTRAVEAHYPTILTQPSIRAAVPAAGNRTTISVDILNGPTVPAYDISYQWYVADNATAIGTALTTGTNSSGSLSSGNVITYTPVDTSTANTKYYYVEITNTNAGQTAKVTSRRFQYAPLPELAADLVVDNPAIEALGETGAVDASGFFSLIEDTSKGKDSNQGVSYTFPASPDVMALYKSIQIFYTVEKITTSGTPANQMKLTVKQGKNSYDDIVGVNGGAADNQQYKDIAANGSGDWKFDLSRWSTKKDGFSLQMNNYRDPATGPNPSCDFKIKITKVVFTNS